MRRRTRRRLRKWTRRSLVLVLVVLLGTALATLALRWVPPPTSSFMLQATSPVRYRWADWDEISPYAALAVVAAEDQKFPDHWGFDLESIQDALRDRQKGGRLRGASTITQQVSKNLFLWSGQSFLRKGVEAYFTVLIEWLWPKQRILEVYLNIAEFGPGIYGVRAASETHFRLSPTELGPYEAALLAAVLPNPKRLNAGQPSAYVRERRDWILSQMWGLGGTAYLNGL